MKQVDLCAGLSVLLWVAGAAQVQAQEASAGVVASAPGDAAGGASESITQQVNDTVITAKVKAALHMEKGLNASAINVRTRHGVVRLTGTVPSAVDKRTAGQVAAGVSGVRRVSNYIKVQNE